MNPNNRSTLRIKTIDERNGVVSEIKELSDLLYVDSEESRRRKAYLLKSYQDVLNEEILRLLAAGDFHKSTVKQVSSYLESIVQELEATEVVTVNIPFFPSASFIDSFYTLITNKLDAAVFLKFVMDPSIIMGFTLDYQGYRTDKSLKVLVNSYINEHKDEILSGI